MKAGSKRRVRFVIIGDGVMKEEMQLFAQRLQVLLQLLFYDIFVFVAWASCKKMEVATFNSNICLYAKVPIDFLGALHGESLAHVLATFDLLINPSLRYSGRPFFSLKVLYLFDIIVQCCKYQHDHQFCVLRYLSETFCIANTEAMAAGVALATFGVGGVGEYAHPVPLNQLLSIPRAASSFHEGGLSCVDSRFVQHPNSILLEEADPEVSLI